MRNKPENTTCFYPEEPEATMFPLPKPQGKILENVSEETVNSALDKRTGSTSYVSSEDHQSSTSNEGASRQYWPSRLSYMLALVCCSMSYVNIFRFPSLVLRWGGTSFLLPYAIFMVFLGYPLHFLESSIGQYSQKGIVKVWDIAPIARGLGYSMLLVCLAGALYQCMYASYALVYFSRSFKHPLPWHDCDLDPYNPNASERSLKCTPRICYKSLEMTDAPSQHYFYDHVLHINRNTLLTRGLGHIVWQQYVCLFVFHMLVYYTIIKGVKSIGKVIVYFVILPYFLLLTLLTAGFLLEGSGAGLSKMFSGDFSNIFSLQVWRVAAEEVLFELGISQGIPLTYASYCDFYNPLPWDSLYLCFIAFITSIISAMIVFCVLGAIETDMGIAVSNFNTHGPGVGYVAYSELLARIPGSNFFSFCFFLMIFLVTIGIYAAIMETILTAFYERFPHLKKYSWLLNLLAISLLCVTATMTFCLANGYQAFFLLDYFATMPRLLIAVIMLYTITFVYGLTRYSEDMEFMLDSYPLTFLKICFKILPFILMILVVVSWIFLKGPKLFQLYYPLRYRTIGWICVFIIILPIPVLALQWVYYCYKTENMQQVFRPRMSWSPQPYLRPPKEMTGTELSEKRK